MSGSVKKLKGFTLVELMVVIVIIAILGAVLIPMLISYINVARVGRINANARVVYGAAVYSLSDCMIVPSKGTVLPNAIYTGDSSDLIAYSGGSGQFSLADYLEPNFKGYFAFETDSKGGCKYALWSEHSISASDVEQLTQQDIKSKYVGCYPIKADP